MKHFPNTQKVHNKFIKTFPSYLSHFIHTITVYPCVISIIPNLLARSVQKTFMTKQES